MAKEKKKTLVLLDTHAILHRAYHAIPDLSGPGGEPTGALYGLTMMVLKIMNEFSPEYIVACFDLPGGTYRHEMFEDYKAGRKDADEALISQLERARDLVDALNIPRYEHEGYEADDMLGTIVEQLKGEKDLQIIIASGDMDTLQLVDKKRVQVYTLRKGIKDTVLYDDAAVKERFGFAPKLMIDYKGLRGDPSDNIPGIQGIGEKMATQLITTFGGIDKIYKKLKKDEQILADAGIKPRTIKLLKEGEDEALFSKELATIHRDAPITFTLPKETWRDSLGHEDVLGVCNTYGFRSLIPRFEALLDQTPVGKEEDIAPDEVEKTGLALWLLESDTTNPTYDDIIAYAQSNGAPADFESAQNLIFTHIKERGLESLYRDIELPLREVLRGMELRGVELDQKYLDTLSAKMHKELDALEKEIYEYAGTEFNINSPKQLADVLYDTLGLGKGKHKKTATGQRSTKESELQKLVDEHEIIPRILRYREVQKLVSTYVDAFPKLVGPDGRIHTHFMQAGTTTGRMASRDPNMQNLPMRTEEGRMIRNAFVASDGFVLAAIDYAQIELRLAACMSGDERLLEIFQGGEDIHSGVAARVFGVALDDVTSDMRRRAKVINFGILYGMGVNALRTNLGEDTTREEAQHYLDAYFNTFSRLAEYLEEVKAFAREKGYTETLFGRRRYFPGISSSVPFMRAQAERMAVNAPIQGTEADIVRVAMVRIDEYIKREKLEKDVYMLLQVHDELVFEIREGKQEQVIKDITKIMSEALPTEKCKGVELETSYGVGTHWGDVK